MEGLCLALPQETDLVEMVFLSTEEQGEAEVSLARNAPVLFFHWAEEEHGRGA